MYEPEEMDLLYRISHHHHPLATMKEILFHQVPLEAVVVAAKKQEGLEVLQGDMG